MINLSNMLQKAITNFQQNNIPLAENLCNDILKIYIHQPDALHILALINKQKDNLSQAEKYFILSLKAKNNQPAVYLNFANLLAQTERNDLASENYDKSLKLSPNNVDALYNWSLLLNKMGNYSKVIEIINLAIKINSSTPKYYNVLANAYKNLEQYEFAIKTFKQALQLAPNDFFAWHNLGVTYRIQGNPQDALNCYQKITAIGNDIPEFHFNLGCAYYDLKQLNFAELSLKKAIKLRPNYVMAHEAINNLYWENSQKSDFLQTYNLYLKSNQAPTEEMYFSYAAQLILSKQLSKAINILEKAIKTYGSRPNFCHALATIYIKKNHMFDKSEKLIQVAVKNEPNNIRYRIDMANILIRQSQYKEALSHLDIALSISPLNQEIWAYKGICWRLLKDERELWLNNYKQFISIQKINAPDNYDNLEHFIYELKVFLKALHSSTQQPLDQSVVGGSQTQGNLLLNSAPIIQQLKKTIYNNAEDYIKHLPIDPTHPFLSRIKEKFKFSGCWSVLLNEKGFHTNHVHPEGWLSGPTYISVPKDIQIGDLKKSGWVKFGETSLNLGEREEIGLEHCPEEGDCVFFPSYMWHGTNPTVSSEARMTTPCDIQPLK